MKCVIIGAGPSGLTLAWCLSQLNIYNQITVIEKEPVIGGCHAVNRVNGLFSEHGPRVYISNYMNFKTLLKEFGTSFNELFTEYKSALFNVPRLSIREYLIMTYYFVTLNESYRSITMRDVINKWGFSEASAQKLDRICRLTDGASIDRYTLYQFLQLPNQNLLYKISQPRHPNDEKLLKIWGDALRKNKVNILLNTKVKEYCSNQVILTNGNVIAYDTLIFAIPPLPLVKEIKDTPLKDAFLRNHEALVKWANKTRYITYVSITYYVPRIHITIRNMDRTDWGVEAVILSDYMTFPVEYTVISALASILDIPSTVTGLTVNQTRESSDLEDEVYRQLRQVYPELPLKPVHVVNTQNYYDDRVQGYQSRKEAYFATKDGFIPFESDVANVYTCGAHTGHNNYSFNALESAVENAFNLMHKIHPQSRSRYPLRYPWTIRKLMVIVICVIALIAYLIWQRK